jgi:hypothetical protein
MGGEIEKLSEQYRVLKDVLNERSRRIWAGTEVIELGRGGLSWVCQATGLSHNTVEKGLAEAKGIRAGEIAARTGRIRKEGGGRKRAEAKDPGLDGAIKKLVEGDTRGDPMQPLLWTDKSTYKLSEELSKEGHKASPRKVAHVLKEEGYSLQSNRKTKEGAQNPDRNAQFEYINKTCLRFMKAGEPVISVDTKKKELIGEYKNNGREWKQKRKPDEVVVHDFIDPDKGKAIPYGVYDVKANEGWVSVGIDHDTADFASEAIYRWWIKMGSLRYPKAKKLLINCDGGGSNGSRSRLWKAALQSLANKTGLIIYVCHFPPGTSKWNKIEHRMFSHITENWRGRPLVSHEIIVNLIANTTTRSNAKGPGLRIQAELDTGTYETGKKISDAELEKLKIHKKRFHGDWNYSINPQ